MNRSALLLLSLLAAAYSAAAGKFATGSFTRPNEKSGEPITFHYRVPLGQDDQPLSSARQLIFYAPCFGEKKYFHESRLLRYSEEFGYSLLTMEFKSDSDDIGIRDRYYIFPEAGYHRPIFDAARELREKFGFAPRKLLLFGISSGGSLAAQLAVHHPSEVLAAASAGGRFFDPAPAEFPVPMLLINTFGCPNRPATRAFAAAWPKTARYPLWSAQTPPVFAEKGSRFFHHTPSDSAYDLMAEFLHGAAEQAEHHDGELLPAEQWPEAAQPEDEAPGCYPSADFAKLWRRLPHRALKQLETPNPDLPLTVLLPPDSPPDRIVLYLHDPLFNSATTLADNLYYLAVTGAAAATVVLDDDLPGSLFKIEQALAELERKEEWGQLPLWVAGSGLGGQLGAVAAQNRSGDRIRGIVTLNSEYRSVFRPFSIEAGRRPDSRPLTMIFDDPELSLPDPAPRLRLLRQRHRTPQFGPGLNWFETLRRQTSGE